MNVEAMWLMRQQPPAGDYVIATAMPPKRASHSVGSRQLLSKELVQSMVQADL